MPDLIPVVDETNVVPWSFSRMNDFETCPRQYEAKYIEKRFPFVQNEAAKWGDAVHKALELYVRDGIAIPSNMVMYRRFADAILAMPGEKIAERQLALNPWLMETGYFAGDVWVRVKIDVTVVNGTKAKVLDYKTGKVKDDPAQLMFYALVVFILYPEVTEVQAGFVWLKEGFVSRPTKFVRSQFEQMLGMWVGKYKRLREAHEVGVFPPKPSGLCNGWCDVRDCEHWKPSNRR